MEVGGEAEGEVGQDRSGEGGVEVFGESSGDETAEEAYRYGGDIAEEESKDWNGDSDCRGHGIHLDLHGCGSAINPTRLSVLLSLFIEHAFLFRIVLFRLVRI